MGVTRIARSHPLVDRTADRSEHAIRATQDAAHVALDGLADSVQALRKTRDNASAYAQRSLDSVRDVGQALRDRALNASDTTVGFIRDEPVKAVLIAAAVGAALMGLATVFGRTRRQRETR